MNTTAPSPAGPPAEILHTHTPALFDAAVRQAAAILRAGHVVALPTETVYGLAANALNPDAVRRIYALKGRPTHNPVIVHVASAAMARACTRHWPDAATSLAAAFWPGPLTLVLHRNPDIPSVVTAGGGTVGIRWPSHPFIQAVIRACGFPLAAPSANRANEVSPTSADHVAASLGDRLPLIVDGGSCQVGIESTVIDLTRSPARILRPGMILEDALQAALGTVMARPTPRPDTGETSPDPPALPSPGMLPRHYAPRARLLCLAWPDDRALADRLREHGADPATTHILAHHAIPSPDAAARICVIPQDPEAYARALYAEWHRSDALGAVTIVLEEVPDLPAWQAIRDRIRRATAPPE